MKLTIWVDVRLKDTIAPDILAKHDVTWVEGVDLVLSPSAHYWDTEMTDMKLLGVAMKAARKRKNAT